MTRLSSWLLLAVLAAACVAVAAYWIWNPHGIILDGPWFVFFVPAGATIAFLPYSAGRRSRGLLAAGAVFTAVSLVLLGFVALVLSFNQL